MRSIIVANGILQQPFKIAKDDILIAANGGLRHCIDLGLQPSIVIGDMDSLDESELSKLIKKGTVIIRHPERKDHTDLELAIKHAHGLGSDEIVLVAALGARWDQTIANLLLPTAFPSPRIYLQDGQQEMHYIRGGESLLIHGQTGDIISLVPLNDHVSDITTNGLEYPLNHEKLIFGSTRGISNVLLGDSAKITLETGLVLCIVIHQ